ncbi:MAG: response regulator [Betaproteobacteria bacterium]
MEDNKDDVELTTECLKAAHVQNRIDVVRDGAEALDYLFRRKPYQAIELPQLVFLDLKLPKISGLEVLRQLRADAITKYLPVVIFTSSKEERDVIQGYQSGANSYMQKPVEVDEFSKAVKALGLYWVLMAQYPPITSID